MRVKSCSQASIDRKSAPISDAACFTLQQCAELKGPIREDLEVLDHEVRSLLTGFFAAERARDAAFLRASATVLLSIAACVQERAAAQINRPIDIESFAASARSAAQWAEHRKLRLALAGEA